jgi:hypothetical protein
VGRQTQEEPSASSKTIIVSTGRILGRGKGSGSGTSKEEGREDNELHGFPIAGEVDSSWQPLPIRLSWNGESGGRRASSVWITGDSGVVVTGDLKVGGCIGSDFPITGEMNDGVVTTS